MSFECSKEPSHRDGYFEYSQHMFWLRNKKNNFQLHTLIWGPVISDFLCVNSFESSELYQLSLYLSQDKWIKILTCPEWNGVRFDKSGFIIL